MPLQSTLASDPDMAELIEFFVDEIGERIDSIRNAAQENNLGHLRIVAHQLKGSATGYGFEPISKCAGELEHMIDHSDPAAEAQTLRKQIDELVNLCQRATR